MTLENNSPLPKIELLTPKLAQKAIMGLVELGGLNYQGSNLVEILYLRLVKKLTLPEISDLLKIGKEPARQKQEWALRILARENKINSQERKIIGAYLFKRNKQRENSPYSPQQLEEYIKANS